MWPCCLGQFGFGKMNENGQRLLELCTYHDLCIANSYFRTKPRHNVSWRHPRSKHWHQMNLILFRRAALKNVLHTRSYHSADCNTDHSLVCCKVRLQPKRFHRTKKQGNPRIEVSKMSQPNLMSQFAEAFEKSSMTHMPKFLSQKSGTFSETLCTAEPWLPSAKRPQRLTIGLTQSRPKWDLSSRLSAPPWWSTNGHPAEETCRFSELQGARFNKPRGAVQTSIGHSSARIYRHPP